MENCKTCAFLDEIFVASRGGKVTVSVTFDNTCGHAAKSEKQEPCYERFSGFATLRVNTDGKR